MGRQRTISLFLLAVSLVTLTANMLPHHHHDQFICLTESFSHDAHDHNEEDESVVHFHCSHHGACDETCVTRLLFLDTADDKLSDIKPLHHCTLLACLVAACLPVAEESASKLHPFTLSQRLPRAAALPLNPLRAPPCLG